MFNQHITLSDMFSMETGTLLSVRKVFKSFHDCSRVLENTVCLLGSNKITIELFEAVTARFLPLRTK